NAPFTVSANVTLPLPVEVRVIVAPSDTASFKVWAPLVVTDPPFKAVLPATSVVKLLKALVPPTAPPNVVVPPVLMVKPKPPLTVPASVILPDPVDVSAVVAPMVTASLWACAPVVVTDPPPSAVAPAVSVVKLTRALEPPTAPPNVVVPLVLTVKAKAPLT